jgi:hypothetical protein
MAYEFGYYPRSNYPAIDPSARETAVEIAAIADTDRADLRAVEIPRVRADHPAPRSYAFAYGIASRSSKSRRRIGR